MLLHVLKQQQNIVICAAISATNGTERGISDREGCLEGREWSRKNLIHPVSMLLQLYLDESCCYPVEMFRRRLLIPRAMYQRLRADLQGIKTNRMLGSVTTQNRRAGNIN